LARRELTWRREKLASEGFCSDEARSPRARRSTSRSRGWELRFKRSSGAAVWLRWRAKQELRSGEPFDNAHGCAAGRTVPECVVLIGGR